MAGEPMGGRGVAAALNGGAGFVGEDASKRVVAEIDQPGRSVRMTEASGVPPRFSSIVTTPSHSPRAV